MEAIRQAANGVVLDKMLITVANFLWRTTGKELSSEISKDEPGSRR
jgi:hypothetical protein